ncbi:MAG: hypothetical protein JWL83_307 [Actinomycetia bacterium]|nr:hypothetical protein [Actinomycetes bacterium]
MELITLLGAHPILSSPSSVQWGAIVVIALLSVVAIGASTLLMRAANVRVAITPLRGVLAFVTVCTIAVMITPR